jgi:hypothetical protein
LWSFSPFETIAMSATPASATSAIPSVIDPTQASMSAENWDSKNAPMIAYVAL